MTTKKKDALIARQELRHQDEAGTWHLVEEGERVPLDHFLEQSLPAFIKHPPVSMKPKRMLGKRTTRASSSRRAEPPC